jgi:hypothetical protein
MTPPKRCTNPGLKRDNYLLLGVASPRIPLTKKKESLDVVGSRFLFSRHSLSTDHVNVDSISNATKTFDVQGGRSQDVSKLLESRLVLAACG